MLFERAYAASPTTTPSHASIFTSRYPLEHGVLRNGLVLRDDFVTLAERLSAAGFTTAGFVAAGALFADAGLAQGFDHFDAPPPADDLPYRSADATVDAVLAWLAAEPPSVRPLFLFVHLFDPHGPQAPPEVHRQRFALRTPAERQRFARYLTERRQIRPGSFGAGIDGMLEQYQNYDAEIRFADAELGRLFDALGGLDRERPWLWIVTADHGQGMGSHLFFGHGKHVYEEQVRVPLLFYAGNGAFPPQRVSAVVEHVDLLPTLAELIDLGPSPAPVRGRSLLPLLRGGGVAEFAEGSALAQRRSYEAPAPERPPGADYELGEKYALVGPRWKLIHRTLGGDELYDLRRDPLETRNRAAAEPARVAALRERLLARLEGLRSAASAAAEPVDPETSRQLEGLGYLP